MSSQKLVNGATGTTISFRLNDQELTSPTDIPDEIMVKFDDPSVGAIFQNGHQHQSIAIKPVTTHFIVQGGETVLRTQFPLIEAWAVTINKAQGMTLDRVVLDIGKKVFEPGMAYVGLSRVKTITGFALLDVFASSVKAPTSALQEVQRLQTLNK